jgi:broad specificity phosphatase PhoE
MSKCLELRRHTDSDGDVLSGEGIEAAVEIGRNSDASFEVAISSGAQRATQTIACILCGHGGPVPGGTRVDGRFRNAEDRWRGAYEKAGAGDIASFREADPELVETESRALAEALREALNTVPEGGRALVVGHSPMLEAAVFGLTSKAIEPLSKGTGVLVVEQEDGDYRVEAPSY